MAEYQDTPNKQAVGNTLADDGVGVVCKYLENGLKHRQDRFDLIEKFEDSYEGKETKALKGRNNYPFDSVVMRGFIDTLMSKTDEPMALSFGRELEKDKMVADKVTAAYERESAPDTGKWAYKELGSKKIGAFAGRIILKKYSKRVDGKFKDCFEVVDHWDFVTEALGGGFLDDHKFKAQMNIFRTAKEMNTSGYSKAQVAKLIRNTSTAEGEENETLYRYKVRRMRGHGVDYDTNKSTGDKLYRLVEAVVYFRGEWYNVVFNYEHKIWLKFDKLTDAYSVAKDFEGRGPWISWATHFDPFNFWSIGPCDSIYPIASAMKKVFNLTLDNLEKRNWDRTAYNPRVFKEPRQLLYKQDGLVKASLKQGESINNHIFQFETPDTTAISINMFEYMNSFLGEKTGITAAAQGKADEEKVGIFFGNMQAVADRFGLANKMYEQAHIDIGVNFVYGLRDNAPEKYMVNVMGPDGIGWEDTLKRTELIDTRFTIAVKSTDAEAKMNEALNARKERALSRIQQDPVLRGRVNGTWYLREILGMGGYDSQDIRSALDVRNDADENLMAEAALAIDMIVKGQVPKLNRGATTGFIQKILDYTYNAENLDEETFKTLIQYADAHMPIARTNAIRAQQREEMFGDMRVDGGSLMPQPEKAPGVPEGTAPAATPGQNDRQ